MKRLRPWWQSTGRRKMSVEQVEREDAFVKMGMWMVFIFALSVSLGCVYSCGELGRECIKAGKSWDGARSECK